MNETDGKPKVRAMAPGETVGLLALAVSLLAALWMVHRYLHGLGDRAVVGPADFQQALGQVRMVLLFAAALLLASAAVLGRLLWRIGQAAIAQEHFPPAGVTPVDARVPRDGAAAKRLGGIMCKLGIATAVAGVIAAALAAAYAFRL
jgi:hypothetical protein